MTIRCPNFGQTSVVPNFGPKFGAKFGLGPNKKGDLEKNGVGPKDPKFWGKVWG